MKFIMLATLSGSVIGGTFAAVSDTFLSGMFATALMGIISVKCGQWANR